MFSCFMILISLFTIPQIDFLYSPGIFKNEKGLELRVYCEIDGRNLTLVKEEENFNAAYSISIILKKGERERGNIWMRKVEDLSYGTQKTFFDTIRVDITPGLYDLTIVVSDLNSQKSSEKQRSLSVDSSMASDFAISSMIPNKNNRLIAGNRVTNLEGISYFMEVYSDREATFYFASEDYKDSLSIIPGTTPIDVLPTIKKPAGNYAVFTASIKSDDYTFERADTLFLGSPIFYNDELFKSRVMALTYIFTTPKLDTLLMAKPEQRDSLWFAFWKSVDPTPETERNELMDEYLTRLNYVESHLGGWQTDMGKVWLVMGMPDEIDRHPFEVETWAYEIWYYYSVNEKFIFYDKHGLGVYELVYPENWNPWRKM